MNREHHAQTKILRLLRPPRFARDSTEPEHDLLGDTAPAAVVTAIEIRADDPIPPPDPEPDPGPFPGEDPPIVYPPFHLPGRSARDSGSPGIRAI